MAKKVGGSNANKIAVDAMGGNYAPQEVVKGAVEAAQEFDIDVVLVGQPGAIDQELSQYHINGLRISSQPASETIGMDEDPVRAIRRKQDSSIVVGANLVKSGQASAFVSGGSTGAVAAAALLILGRRKHISRPALVAVIESPWGPRLFLDVGANADCKPHNLLQFAEMGSIYMKKIYGTPQPRVALLSSGEESFKGSKLARSAYALLTKSHLNFIGNLEGNDITNGAVDVIVTDGFTGNVVIKVAEGLEQLIKQLSSVSENGDSFFTEAKKHVRYSEGALLLGVNGNVIITHGSSDANAIKQSIHVADQMVKEGVTEAIGA